jgi:hypothetical protein
MPVFLEDLFSTTLDIIIDYAFLIVPIVLGIVLWKLWVAYIRTKFIIETNWTLLEVKLPREITKSPRAMEIVLNAMHNTGIGSKIDQYIKGRTVIWYSLEIASIEGSIHFFVRTPKKLRNLVESQLFAQYPEVEVVEVDDYSKFSLSETFQEEWTHWGTEFILTKSDVYPIRTYVDYGLGEMGTKEEFKSDPITSFLEYLGSIGRDEQIWFQVMIKGDKGSTWAGTPKKKIKGTAEKELEKIAGIKDGDTADEKSKKMTSLTHGKQEVVKAIGKNVAKISYSVGLRAHYLAKKDNFNPVNIASLTGTIKQYNAQNLNGFRPNNTTTADYPPFKAYRLAKQKEKMIDLYRRRAYFYLPYECGVFSKNGLKKREPMLLNTESLATIFHFPGHVAETPTFGRIEAKKREPPPNLPI